ncbi:MAG: hypothetical protein DLM67_08820 [Candidatus Nephthysia bennettiae]|uniref:DUF1700 domain-containing protein n=1 Tax=Candidatus Nephthysia bennettiae TaxID=3127016 RepID=A0A934K6T4_9BACT|nr:hypothetical protein [Candidatus Dormibacteraeota bacterium]MBJ7611742.1 hypothetical protein [Candidatus Dormibacteraeota bacterium]PZR97058.1 MAG: hypothetical protein DLM67_08820 [Candidatus Dormibacteraeota bacterium]
MTAPHAAQIISGYMARLQDALSTLPRGRRDEILAEIEEHIASARAELRMDTDADVLEILDRVGDPAEIAEEARHRFGVPERGPGPLEIAALLLIGFSGLIYPIPPVGWVLGVLLLWFSPCWTQREKRLGAYLPLVTALAAGLLASLIGPFIHDAIVPMLVAAIFVPMTSAAYLALRLGRRLPPLAWAGLALVATFLILSPLLVILPTRTYAFLGPDGPPMGTSHGLPATHCGGFYGTTEYGFGIAGRAETSLGLCIESGRVRRTWGPDCYANAGPVARIEVTPCTIETLDDGSLMIVSQSKATATTSASMQSYGTRWVVTPDGTVHGPPG